MKPSIRSALADVIDGPLQPPVRLVLSPSLESHSTGLRDLITQLHQTHRLEVRHLSVESMQQSGQDMPSPHEAMMPVTSATNLTGIPVAYAVTAPAETGSLSVNDQAVVQQAVADKLQNKAPVVLALLPSDNQAGIPTESAEDPDAPQADPTRRNEAIRQLMANTDVAVVESVEGLQAFLQKLPPESADVSQEGGRR